MQTRSPCHVFTTLRYDGDLTQHEANTVASNGLSSAIYLLQAHFDRLLEAADATLENGRDVVLDGAGLSNAPKLSDAVGAAIRQARLDPREQVDRNAACFRVRLQIDEHGVCSCDVVRFSRIDPESLFPLSLHKTVAALMWETRLDRSPTAKSNATQFKTDDRRVYNRARAATGITSFSMPCEVLLYDNAGNIMDGSITTPYFWRSDHWVTPEIEYGGQQGTTRRWALANGLCLAGCIHKSSLMNNEMIWLSNAARGFFQAVYRSDAHAAIEGE